MQRNEQIDELVHTISEYFVDPATQEIQGERIENWKILLGVLSYIGRKNTLLLGRPGSGKTTFSGVISATLSGLPYDIFDTLKVQGHPDQTKDTMLARADLGRLAEEGVVWQQSLYLPSLTFDEFNRLPPGKQSIVMEYVREATVEHLGKHLRREKIPFFATMNYNGAGTYPLTPAMLDRFDISLEFPVGSCFTQYGIQAASRKINAKLANPAETDRIIKELLRKDVDQNKKLELMQQEIKKRQPKLKADELTQRAAGLSYEATADTFRKCLWEELNTTPRYGEKRSVDPVDDSSHNKCGSTPGIAGMPAREKFFANANVIEGISPRCWDDIDFYSRMLAAHTGSDCVMIDHVQAVAPHCMAHRLTFTEDFKAAFKQSPRLQGEREEMDLTRRTLKDIKENYNAVSRPLNNLDGFATEYFPIKEAYDNMRGRKPEFSEFLRQRMRPETYAEAKKICENSVVPDHPLFKTYYHDCRELLGMPREP
jgi:MoxR-like ATPase